eukprot:8865663-Alexandrium_andersonii.AAC.1
MAQVRPLWWTRSVVGSFGWRRGILHGAVAPDTAAMGLEVRRWPRWMVAASLARPRAWCSLGFELLEGR